LPVYGFESLLRLAGLANLTMLRRHRRQLADGQRPVGCYWSGHDYVSLYREAEAVDMPSLPAGRQRRYDAARTCAECGARALDPFERGDDGQRYCPSCQGPVHRRLWEQARAADRPVIAGWARGVFDDPTVVLGATLHRGYYREVCVADLAGTVLLDVKVRYVSDDVIDPRWLARLTEEHPDALSPADLGEALGGFAGRRLVTWWPTTGLPRTDDSGPGGPVVSTAEGDHFGYWYDRWVGELSGPTYRYVPRLATQWPPAGPREQVDRMRTLLTEMAGRRLPEGAPLVGADRVRVIDRGSGHA